MEKVDQGEKQHTCCLSKGKKQGELANCTEDTLAKKLIASIEAMQVDVERTISKERERIVKDKATLGVILNQLLLELEEEVNKKVYERVSGSEDKIEEIKLEIEQCERKIFSLDEYAQQLSRSLRILKETSQWESDKGGDDDYADKGTQRDNRKESKVNFVAHHSASPSTSSSSSSVTTSSVHDRRSCAREWRKQAIFKQDVCSWKIITPKILQARQHLNEINHQLNVELGKQLKTGRGPSKAMMRKLETLKKKVDMYEKEIKEEEERAVNVYKSIVLSQASASKL